MSTVQGNASQKVEIVVLETSASYCPAERVANNRGDFRCALPAAAETAPPSPAPAAPPPPPLLHLRPQGARGSPHTKMEKTTSFCHPSPSSSVVFKETLSLYEIIILKCFEKQKAFFLLPFNSLQSSPTDKYHILIL